ncbi:HAMP domain-containing sensor histidine kinase [Roseburia hominis]
MKLWQKIFLISLLGIYIAVEGTAVTVTWSNFKSIIEQEEEQIVSSHNDIAVGIVNRALYERLRQNKVVLGQDAVRTIVNDVVSSRQTPGSFTELYSGGEPWYTYKPEILEEKRKFREKVAKSEGTLAMITRYQDVIYCIAGTKISMEGREYEIYSVSDISSIYAARGKQIQNIGMISILFSAGIAIVLMVYVYRLLAPLGDVNLFLNKMADGNYGKRLEIKGNIEFQTLEENVNLMAESIENHVERVQGIADERKRFIDNLAHEMKTPLTSIMGFADILRIKREVSEKQRREYADIIVKEAGRLKSLSGKILELATTESVRLDYEIVAVRELFAEINTALLPVFKKREISLRISSEEVNVYVDRELFKSLLYNLLDNALKASESGGEVRLRCARRDGSILLSVSDDGVGMTKEQVRRVTEPFYMVDKSRSRKAGGAGLGLSLCVEIVKRHHARLSISSRPGRGTTVSIRMEEGDGV